MKLHFITAVIALATSQVLAQGTTVQLPTFSFTTVGTTVSVPDGGSAYLGGIDRASSGRNEFGVPMLDKLPFVGRPFKNVGIGQDRSASSFRVTATIHDLDAMDEAILNGSPTAAAFTRSSRFDETPASLVGRTLQPRTANLAGNWAPPTDAVSGPALTVADEQSRRVAQQQSRGDEATKFFERGRQAEADGKANVARIYYQMAARRASGDLKQQALARLEAVAAGATAKIAQSQQ